MELFGDSEFEKYIHSMNRNSMNRKIITEAVFANANIDRENGLIHNVVILSADSKNSRHYTDAALASAVAALEGRPSFYIHSYSKNRDLKRELIGNFINLKQEGIRVKGSLQVLKKEEDFIFDIAERMPQVAGFSIDADIRYQVDPSTGKEIAQEIVRGNSIDLVTDPATTKSIFENQQSEENSMELEQALHEENKRLRESKQQQSDDQRVRQMQEQINQLQAEKAQNERDLVVMRKVQESHLPESAISDVFRSQLNRAQDEKEIDALLFDRKQIFENQVTRVATNPAGGFLGNGNSAGGKVTQEEIERELGI